MPHDAPTTANSAWRELSQDIRYLGARLGEVIRLQHGDAALQLVEDIRAQARQRRDHEQQPGTSSALAERIATLDLEAKHILIKAFANYFQLINIAEDHQRLRVLRQRELQGYPKESLAEAVATLRDAGLSAAAVRQLLTTTCVRLVLTAHPSEAKRKEVLVKLRHIADLLAQRERHGLTPREYNRIDTTLSEHIEALWQTRPTRRRQLIVADEVDFGLYFLTAVIMDVVTDIYAELRDALTQYYPAADWSTLPLLLRYASWIGGDRDGNPNVTADVTLETLATHHRIARAIYLHELACLRAHLTQSNEEVNVAQEVLDAVQHADVPPIASPDELYRRYVQLVATNQVIATWRMIAAAHRTYGHAVIDTVIASMSQAPSDILTMLLFAKDVGIHEHIDLVPLFETIDDLHRAPTILRVLFEKAHYRHYLAQRGQRQQVMIGYSDSTKDGGYLASNWGLYTAQEMLGHTCAAYGIALECFHGRGGSIGRGGGPTHRSILAAPVSSLHGRIKITEQGEVIAYRYSNPEIARRHLHQVLNAVLVSLGAPPTVVVQPAWREAMAAIAAYGGAAYRQLVYETQDFLVYWQQATPIDELSSLSISSRPARRRQGGFAGLRAISWVFSWTQSRALIPSWYGVGYAFETFCQHAEGHVDLLRRMYREWLFFTTLIDNVQLDLAKADMGIAALYDALVDDNHLRQAIFPRIQAEHARTCQMLCTITEQKRLLDNAPVMQRSIERRNPYVDPLNFIQADLLRVLRQLPPNTPAYDRVLALVQATINGIAAGMKNTG